MPSLDGLTLVTVRHRFPKVDHVAERPRPSDGEGFDALMERLRAVVEKLETGSLTLEQSLAAFEEGVRLSRRGAQILDQAEQRIEILTRGEDGDERAGPFHGVGEDAAG